MPANPLKRVRVKRYNDTGHAHELTFSCYRRQPLLEIGNSKQLLANAINMASDKHSFDVWAYVFMPEHVHLLVFPDDPDYSIASILKSIKQSTSRNVIFRLKRENDPKLNRLATGLKNPEYRFWQDGGGYDRNYWKPEEIRKQVDYIHANPVRRGLVDRPEDYLWSSASDWMMDEGGPVIIGKESFPI